MNNQKAITTILSTIVLALPMTVAAQVGIPCDGPNCDFNSLIKLINNIIKFLMFSVAVPLAALGFMFMGGKMVLLSNKEAAKTEAKQGIGFIITGFLIMLGAYVFIKTILFMFITDDQKTFMNFMFQ
ncbi:MAG: hypothetical protein WC791_03390 [Candidatus Paceibacterota bacterium]|jgi:hypothetical protein